MASVKKSLQITTRLLLALWDLGGTENKILKGKLNERAGRNKDNAAEYDKVYKQLEQDGAIAIITTKKKVEISLTEQGLKRLREALKNPQFEFSSQIGSKTANALLNCLREMNTAVVSQAEPVNGKSTIASYDEFKSVALDVYDKLNYEYNFNHLVPIYRIRREIGDRISRTQFNDWLLEMQSDDILQLQGGTVEDNARDKIEDSITTELNGLRCYAKRLKP